MNEDRTYSISEVAEQTGLSTDTLRYYEKIGLLASPTRGGGQKRMYDEGDIGRIRFFEPSQKNRHATEENQRVRRALLTKRRCALLCVVGRAPGGDRATHIRIERNR